MERSDEPRLAVLIDADNTAAKWADAIFEEIATLGEASVRRIYGDFSGPHLRSWEKKLAGLAVIPHQQFAYTKGKNSSDIALVIDAMDLMHTGRFDGFVLVSSDSDFARLASRLREQGLQVSASARGTPRTPSARRASGSSAPARGTSVRRTSTGPARLHRSALYVPGHNSHRLPRPTTARLPRPFALSAGFVQHGHHYGHEAEIMLEVSVAKARNALTQLIHEAEGGKVVHITRRGKSVAVLVSREEYDRLESQDSKRDFWQAIEDWRAQASFDWPELTPEEVDGWRDRHRGREFSWPD